MCRPGTWRQLSDIRVTGFCQPSSQVPSGDLDEGPDVPPEFEEVDEGELGEAGKNWVRPPAPALNSFTDRLGEIAQQLNVITNQGGQAVGQTGCACPRRR